MDLVTVSSSPVWLHLGAFLASKSPKTKETYIGILKEFCSYLNVEPGSSASSKALLKVTHLHAIAFQEWLKKRPGINPRLKSSTSKALQKERFKARKKDGTESTQSNATIWKKCAALRRMYRVLVSAGLGLKENPFDSDRAPPPPKDSGRKRPTEMVDFSLVQEILSSPDITTEVGRRDRAILSLLFGAGLRRSEVANLRIGDIRRSQGGNTYLYLRSTKAKKDSEQAIPEWAGLVIKDWIKDRKKHGALDGDYLFVSYLGKDRSKSTDEPISHTGIWRLFKRYCLLVGAGSTKSPHSARATAITKLLTDGIPHRLVQAFSRHASIQMVEVYDKRRLTVEDNPGLKLDWNSG